MKNRTKVQTRRSKLLSRQTKVQSAQRKPSTRHNEPNHSKRTTEAPLAPRGDFEKLSVISTLKPKPLRRRLHKCSRFPGER